MAQDIFFLHHPSQLPSPSSFKLFHVVPLHAVVVSGLVSTYFFKNTSMKSKGTKRFGTYDSPRDVDVSWAFSLSSLSSPHHLFHLPSSCHHRCRESCACSLFPCCSS